MLAILMDAPEKPDESDCCNSGCTPCIFDVYEEQLKKYNERLNPGDRQGASENCIYRLKYAEFTLTDVQMCSSDTCICTFESTVHEDAAAVIYEPGQHFLLKAYSQHEQNYFTRAYTPIPVKGLSPRQFAVLVRLYEQGEMSEYFRRLTPGTATVWRGPYGDYALDCAQKHTLMIAQGTGIAPIYAVIHNMLQNDECDTVIKLFYCCRSGEDIMLRDELYELCRHWNFSYEVFLSGPNGGTVKYNEVVHECRLGETQIVEYLLRKVQCKVLICGSKGFMDQIKSYVSSFDMQIDVFTF